MMKTGSMVLFKFVFYYYLVHAQLLFCRCFQIQTRQHKQTRDLSSSNKWRLLKIGFDVSKSVKIG